MKYYTEHDLGNFVIRSGNVIVSDPCYERGTWCAGNLSNVKKGVWHSSTLKTDEGAWGNNRTAVLIAHHESARDIDYETNGWKEQEFEVGVDSGQAGIFDSEDYHGEDNNFDDPNSWYRQCCNRTIGEDSAGVIEGGVVSSSGYGDGSYVCATLTDEHGEIIGIMITFIMLEDDEEEEEWEDNEEDDKKEDDEEEEDLPDDEITALLG